MRIVVDTNILVSALLFSGIPSRLIDLWKDGRLIPLASREIMNEYIRVLAYPKFRLAEDEINHLLAAEVLPWFEMVPTQQGDPYVAEDLEDDKFIWCALAGKAEAIISGDALLLSCTASPVPVLSSTSLLDRLANGVAISSNASTPLS